MRAGPTPQNLTSHHWYYPTSTHRSRLQNLPPPSPLERGVVCPLTQHPTQPILPGHVTRVAHDPPILYLRNKVTDRSCDFPPTTITFPHKPQTTNLPSHPSRKFLSVIGRNPQPSLFSEHKQHTTIPTPPRSRIHIFTLSRGICYHHSSTQATHYQSRISPI